MNLVGKVAGVWKLVARLGEGGMGEVYLAEHQSIGRKAAVKVLHPQYAAQPSVVDRFFNEARAANKVRHPSIIEIWDYGQAPDVGAYFVMEFLEGESLQNRIKDRVKLTAPAAVSLLTRVASAVGAAHKAGIIHRDLKPDNIFILPDTDHHTGERVKVLDFGIAKLSADGGVSGSKTRTGAVMGTPVYMSPEQCHGAKSVDVRTDVYALGVIAYEALTGRPPFMAQGFGEMLAMHLSKAPTPLREVEPSVPEKLEAVVLKALAKDPDQRFATMEEMSAAMIDAVDGVRQSYPVVPAGPQGTRVLPPPSESGKPRNPSETELFDSRPTSYAPSVRSSTLTSSAAEVGGAPAKRSSMKLTLGIVGGLAAAAAITAGVIVLVGPGGSADGHDGPDARDVSERDDDPREKTSKIKDGTGKKDTAEPETSARPDRDPEDVAVTARPETAKPATAAATTSAAGTATDPKIAKVRHVIDSKPFAALVVRVSDGAEMGLTPWESSEPAGKGKVTYELRREGYKPARVTLAAARDDHKSVKLVALRTTTGRPPKTAEPGSAKPETARPKEPTTHAPEFPTPD